MDTAPLGLTVFELAVSIVMRYGNGQYIRESDYKQPKVHRGNAGRAWTAAIDPPFRLAIVPRPGGGDWLGEEAILRKPRPATLPV